MLAVVNNTEPDPSEEYVEFNVALGVPEVIALVVKLEDKELNPSLNTV